MNNVSLSGLATSIFDYKLIIFDFTLTYQTKCTDNITISYRKFNVINVDTFTASASFVIYDVFNFSCPSKISDLYHSAIAEVLDENSQIRTRSISMSRSSPWYNNELRAMKAKGRQLERLFWKTGLTVNLQEFSDHVKHYKTALNAAHSSYIYKIINKANNRPKSLFSMVNRLVQDALCGTFGAELTTSTCELALSI